MATLRFKIIWPTVKFVRFAVLIVYLLLNLHHWATRKIKDYFLGQEKQRSTMHFAIVGLIMYMKKLLDSDWLRAVQFKRNTSEKSVTAVQITHHNPGL